MPSGPDPQQPRNEAQRWDSELDALLRAPAERLWRAHADAVNAAVFAPWLPARSGRVLKTDAYDEAMGAGLAWLLTGTAERLVCVDVAPAVVAAARLRHPALTGIVADVRALPFPAASFDVVLSNSTLDHFDSHGDIDVALEEIHRVLAPGGRFILSMDNRANPVVALRNALPARLLRRIGLVEYPLGATYGPRRLAAVVRRHGFEVSAVEAMLHCPRVLAVARSRRLERQASAAAKERYTRSLRRWEHAARWPTRFLTGYFVALCAHKR